MNARMNLSNLVAVYSRRNPIVVQTINESDVLTALKKTEDIPELTTGRENA